MDSLIPTEKHWEIRSTDFYLLERVLWKGLKNIPLKGSKSVFETSGIFKALCSRHSCLF